MLSGMDRRELSNGITLLLAGTGATMMIAAAVPGDYQALLFWGGLSVAAAGIAGFAWLFLSASKDKKKPATPTAASAPSIGGINIGSMGDNLGHVGHNFYQKPPQRTLTDQLKREILLAVGDGEARVCWSPGDAEAERLAKEIIQWLTKELGRTVHWRVATTFGHTPTGISFGQSMSRAGPPERRVMATDIIIGANL